MNVKVWFVIHVPCFKYNLRLNNTPQLQNNQPLILSFKKTKTKNIILLNIQYSSGEYGIFQVLVIMTPTWGERGHLDLLRFPRHRNVSRHPPVCASLCLSDIWYSFFADGFQILRYGDYGQDLELINAS